MDKNMCTKCEWEVLPNKAKNSNVLSYSLKVECNGCKAKREANNAAQQAKDEALAYEKRKADLIKEKSDDISIEELKKDGVLDADGEIISGLES